MYGNITIPGLNSRPAENYQASFPKLGPGGYGVLPLGTLPACVSSAAGRLVRSSCIVKDDPTGTNLMLSQHGATTQLMFVLRPGEVLEPGLYTLFYTAGDYSSEQSFIVPDSPWNSLSQTWFAGTADEGLAWDVIYRGRTSIPPGETLASIVPPFMVDQLTRHIAWNVFQDDGSPAQGLQISVTSANGSGWNVQVTPPTTGNRIIDWVIY
jgi:5-hydroxyisourate hydrolase-like protein (transthyretin family)